MAQQIASLYAEVTADTTGIEKGLKRTREALDDTGAAAKQSGTKFTELASKLELAKQAYSGIATVGKAVIQFGKESLALYGIQEQAEKQLAQTIKSTGSAAGLTSRELRDYASSLQQMTTYGDEAIIGAESLLLTFTNIKGPVMKDAIATVLDMSQALGQDLKSSSIQLGKALNDPIEGISALSRVGVSFTQQQKDQIKAMVELGDTAGAQAVILAELNKEFGGQAQAAATTYAGKIEQLSNNYGDLKEEIGETLSQQRGFIDILNKGVMTVTSGIANQNEMTRAVNEGYIAQDKLIDRLKEGTDAGLTYDDAVQQLVDSFHDWEDAQLAAIDVATDYDRIITGQIGRWEYATSAAYIMTDAQIAEMKAASDAALANSELADKVLLAGNHMSETEALIYNANAAIHEQKEGLDLANYSWDELIKKIGNFSTQSLVKEMKRGRDEAGFFGEAVNNLALRLGALPSEVFVKIRVTREGDNLPGEVGGGGFTPPGEAAPLPDDKGDKTPAPPAPPPPTMPGAQSFPGGRGAVGQSVRGGTSGGAPTVIMNFYGMFAASPEAIAGKVSQALTPRG